MVARPLTPEVEDFKFISIKGPCSKQSRGVSRLAKSHATKRGLKAKRLLEQKSNHNFRVAVLGKEHNALVNESRLINPPVLHQSLSASEIDPFGMLPVDTSRLQILLENRRARVASEPVFSMSEELAFQNFHAVFRTGLTDPALSSAVMFSLLFAATEGSLDIECLKYKGCAIGGIRDKITCIKGAVSESTIGAILLLAGVEAQLGMTSQVQLHMSAVRQLLDLSRSDGIYLTGGIKRAIFWQDLNASILSGSDRIVDHDTFSELRWQRDSFTPSFYQLPSGFEVILQLLNEDFVEILEDIHALQCIRNYSTCEKGDPFVMAYINNYTASIQSRLANLTTISPILKCCSTAAYICSIMLCCHPWCASVIPSYLSSQLLGQLQKVEKDYMCDEYADLMLWLLYVGGTFAPPGSVRSTYAELIRSNIITRFGGIDNSHSKIFEMMRKFIWSDLAFFSRASLLWEEIFV
ncbi:hypothetical protein J3E68DRAFT_61904 [Trichoderma sp. SZMC 28012]